MNRLIIMSFLLLLPFLFSCQNNNHHGANAKVTINSLYLDEQFLKQASFTVESEQDIFMIDDDMLLFVENDLNKISNPRKKALKLLNHIFSQEALALSYSNNANLIAREAYHGNTANCMSLTIMAYTLAKAANLSVNFQQVDVPEYWVRNGQYNVRTGHVNLLVKLTNTHNKHIVFGSDNVVIDFDPFVSKKKFNERVIDKNTVLAMFYNNKGSQALVDKKHDIAYQYFKAATQADINFSAAWGNLAVLYRLTGNDKEAENTYRYALKANPKNLTALTNLAILLRSQNRLAEANVIDNKLLNKRKMNPYYHALLADEAYYKNDYSQAIKHFKDATALNSKIHEFYFGMAKTYYQMNRFSKAERSLKKAMVLSKVPSTEQLYAAKLNVLKAYIAN